MGQRRNYKEIKKILWDEWKQIHNISKLMECMKIVLWEKFTAVNTYLKKK